MNMSMLRRHGTLRFSCQDDIGRGQMCILKELLEHGRTT